GALMRRHRSGGIELAPAADPPGALEHGDEAIVGMEVRTAEVVALEPFVDHQVEPGPVGIAGQHGAAVAAGALPLDVVRQLVDHRLRIELGRAGGPGRERARAEGRAYCDRGLTSAEESHGASLFSTGASAGPRQVSPDGAA